MYYINKIVGWCLSPFGALFLGLGFAWLIGIAGRRRSDRLGGGLVAVSKWLSVALLVMTWVMGCGITTRFVGASLEKDWEIAGRPHGDISGLPNADAIIVLGGGMEAHQKCGAPEMYGAADRVWQGARLYKAGKAPVVVMSGPGVIESTAPLLRDFGVPEEALRTFPTARNTEEEAKGIREMLERSERVKRSEGVGELGVEELGVGELGVEELGVRELRVEELRAGTSDSPTHPLTHSPTFKVLLVTSAWHMSRAKLLFDRAGFDVVPAPTDFEMSCALERPVKFEDFFPSAEALMRNSYAVKEWVGNAGYRLLRR